MASALCIQQKSFLLAGSFNGACVDTRSNVLPPSQCYANRSATHGVTRGALAATSPSTEGSVKSSLEGLLQEARMQKGRVSMRAWWYLQHAQNAGKEDEIADSSSAQAGEFARRMEMEEGRAVMRIWWLDSQLRALDPSRPPLPPVKRTHRVPPVRRSPSSTPKQATTVAEGNAVPSGQHEERVTASEELPAPSEVETITTDTTGAQEPATPEDEPVSVDAQAERQRKMDAGRANMRNWWTQEQEASKRAVEGTASETRPAPSESETITADATGPQEPAAPLDELISIEEGKDEEAAQAEREKKMDAGRAKMREWWNQEQEATKRKLELQGAESEKRPAPSEVETIATDTTTAQDVATPEDEPVSGEAQAERQKKMDAGRANMREWWTQQLEATKSALETKTSTADATGAQELGTPADDPVSIKVPKEQEAALKMSPEAQAEQQRGMDAGRANMRKWWNQEQEATKRKLEPQGAESEKRPAPSEVETIATDTTTAQEPATPEDEPVSVEAQAERQKKMDAGRANMREWWKQEQEATKRKLELQGAESEKRPVPSEVKTVTADTTTAQEPATPNDEPVSVEAQAERQKKMDTGRANMREWWNQEQEATKRKLELHGAESEKRSAPSEVKTITMDTTTAQELATPVEDLVSTEVQKEQEAAQAERQRKMDAGRAKMRAWWIEEQEDTKRKLELQGAESEERPAPSEAKTITTDTTRAQEVATPENEPVSVDAQAERQTQMDEGRAKIREWWIKEQEATKPAPEPQNPTESDKRPAPFESKTVTADTAPSELKTVPADTAPSAPKTVTEDTVPSESKTVTADMAPSESETVTADTAPSEPKTVTADTTGTQKLPSPLDILVKIELRKEREAAERRALERQRAMDAGRAKMRKWWIKEREATKRALGLAPYGPVWTLVRTDGKEPPISIGKTPLIIGAEVGDTENMVPVKLDYPTVSGVHAKIFAKEVMSYGEYVRAYFVVDLKSTNGVRRNNNFRLRPGTQYKLSDGDTLFFGEEAATIVIKNPQKSP